MESPGIGASLIGLLAVVALLLTNAYFVATEFALVAVRRTQVQLWVEEGRRGADSAAAAIRDLDDAIAATQLGITIASIGLGFVGEPAVARRARRAAAGPQRASPSRARGRVAGSPALTPQRCSAVR